MTSQPNLRVISTSEAPPPLLPPEIDLADLPEVMLNIQWLCDSRFAMTASAEEQIAAVRLHARSIQQKPAATLPDDDVELAFLAGYGRDVQAWRRVKERAMEGWTLCSDSRFYRRDMAIKALGAWIKRLAQRRKQAAGVAKRKKLVFNPEAYDRPIGTAVNALHALDPHAPVLRNHLNVEPEIEPAAEVTVGERGDPVSHPDNYPDNHKGREAKRSEPSEYISPTGRSPIGAPGRPEGDSGAGEASPAGGDAREKIPPWPDDGFEQIWDLYPRKVDKIAAQKAYDELATDAPVRFDELMRAVLAYTVGKPACNDTAYLATWLNKRRWTDIWPDKPPPKPPRGPPAGHSAYRGPRPFQPTNYGGRPS